MTGASNYLFRKGNSFSPIPGTQYPRQGTCGCPVSDADGNLPPCETQCLKRNPNERCEACKARLKNASRLRANAADRKRARLARGEK